MSERGIAYGVGVGPGDPELMTVKAIKLIRENDIVAVPDKNPTESVAYHIAAAAVPELAEKELVPVYVPMIRDREKLEAVHRQEAAKLESYLDHGKNIVYITLGDPTVYCSFTYLQNILESDGYTVKLVPGVPSFCAAAARLNIPLVIGEESLHVMPAADIRQEEMRKPGTYVLMKAGRRMPEVKEMLLSGNYEVSAAENCTMVDEKLYRGADEIPDESGYFSLIIVKNR